MKKIKTAISRVRSSFVKAKQFIQSTPLSAKFWFSGHASLVVSAALWFGAAQAFGVAGLLFLAMSLIENFDR